MLLPSLLLCVVHSNIIRDIPRATDDAANNSVRNEGYMNA